MSTTFTKSVLFTLVLIPTLGYQPISQAPAQETVHIQTTVSSRSSRSHFKPDYIIIDDKIKQIPVGVSNELETISSLLEIGNILFENSRNESPEELKAMRSYFKSKYKKV